jgi:hypothetical protein
MRFFNAFALVLILSLSKDEDHAPRRISRCNRLNVATI